MSHKLDSGTSYQGAYLRLLRQTQPCMMIVPSLTCKIQCRNHIKVDAPVLHFMKSCKIVTNEVLSMANLYTSRTSFIYAKSLHQGSHRLLIQSSIIRPFLCLLCFEYFETTASWNALVWNESGEWASRNATLAALSSSFHCNLAKCVCTCCLQMRLMRH